MAIDPIFLTCAICETPDAHPFDFLRTAQEEAELQALRQERERQLELGWAGPQFISHPSRALLCDDHHTQADALGLHKVPRSEGLARLRAAARE